MLPEFHNKPSVNLRGSTWDVKHLDNFLSSQWGEKLFQSRKPSENSKLPEQLPFLYTNSSIRPSAAFLSLPRDQPPIQSLLKSSENSLIPSSQAKTYTAPTVDVDVISKKLHHLDEQRARDDQELCKIIPPAKRRQLFEAEKHRNKVYSKLKQEKLAETKKDRVVRNEYRSGVLGVDLTERKSGKSATWGTKEAVRNEKSVETNRALRAHNIMVHTAPSPNVQFFNTGVTEGEPEKPRGLKKVQEIPQHYHDTYSALFIPKPRNDNTERTQRLKELWRGNRDFDIISGSYFKT